MVCQHHHRPQPGQHLHRPVAPLSLPSTLSPRTQQPGTARHAVWGGTTMSRPNKATLRPSGTQNHRTRQQAHTRGVSTNQASGAKGRRDHTAPPHHQSANTKARKHPNEHAPRVNTKPSHPQANTPTASPNKARPQANTKSAHARARGQARCVSAGGPACPGRGDRHEAKQAKPPQGRARRSKRTQGERANNGVCAEAVPPCARQTGGETRAKGRSQ